jgi:hypothetical protein
MVFPRRAFHQGRIIPKKKRAVTKRRAGKARRPSTTSTPKPAPATGEASEDAKALAVAEWLNSTVQPLAACERGGPYCCLRCCLALDGELLPYTPANVRAWLALEKGLSWAQARDLEFRLGLPCGWMDSPHSPHDAVTGHPGPRCRMSTP